MIKCVKFRPCEKNTLKGFADLQLTRTGLVIHDVAWHEKAGKQWVAFPARRYEDKGGNTLWSPLVEFAEDATQAREQFRKQAIAAIAAVASRQARDSEAA